MSEERYHRAKSLFLQALDIELAEREAFLNEACGDDTDLREEIVGLYKRKQQE